jgi:hypothetical protein
MGQGYYNAVVYGITEKDLDGLVIPEGMTHDINGPVESIIDVLFTIEDVFDSSKFHLRTQYEANPAYVGIEVANDDDCMIDRYQGAGIIKLPLRFVIPFGDFYLYLLDLIGAARLTEVQEQWVFIRKGVKAEWGIDLPEGKFMLIADWD